MSIYGNDADGNSQDPASNNEPDTPVRARSGRRGLLQGMGMAGAAITASLLSRGASGQEVASAQNVASTAHATTGDIAMLRFAAFAELIESDLWTQYAELGGNATESPNPYQLAFSNLDGDGNQYITSNTLDELSHAAFVNAYIEAIGGTPVNLDKFRTLPSSQATGAAQIGRLTNLMQLSVDTSWFTRYRSNSSPDFGATYPQALPQLAAGQFPAIPRNDNDFGPTAHIQAIANTAAWHFGSIEQGGSSLYPYFAQKTSSAQVLEVMLGIGGDEICHFLEWVDFAGNSVQKPLAPLTDPTNGLMFPNFIAEHNGTQQQILQPNLIFPLPATFISPNLPLCSVIRPITSVGFTAVGTVNSLAASGLFIGQSADFMEFALKLATAADAAKRHV
jgi:hypothetical protein